MSPFSAVCVPLFSTEIKENLLITDYLRVYRTIVVTPYGYQCFTRCVPGVKVIIRASLPTDTVDCSLASGETSAARG